MKQPRHSKEWYETRRLVRFGQEHTKKKFRRKLLKTGHAVCPDCKGEKVLKRKIRKSFPPSIIRERKAPCLRCRGYGFVDWLNPITGRSFKYDEKLDWDRSGGWENELHKEMVVQEF